MIRLTVAGAGLALCLAAPAFSQVPAGFTDQLCAGPGGDRSGAEYQACVQRMAQAPVSEDQRQAQATRDLYDRQMLAYRLEAMRAAVQNLNRASTPPPLPMPTTTNCNMMGQTLSCTTF